MTIIYASIYRVARARIRKKQFLRTLRIKSERAAAAAAAAAASSQQERNGLTTSQDESFEGASVNVLVTEVTVDLTHEQQQQQQRTADSNQISTTR